MIPAGGQWFDRARFGLFAHWGPYSEARLEPSWPMVGGTGTAVLPFCQDLTVAEYERLTAGWAPPAGAPAGWAELAGRLGVDYAVLTAKHHDGFTLFPSKHSAHGIHRTAPGRDLVGEYVEAFRAAGIRVGLYFSLSDWHHPAYPAFREEFRPYPSIAYPRPSPEDWERYLADQRGQLDELLTGYGTIDLLWFDGGWERTAREWRSEELRGFLLERQPDLVVNDRCPGLPGYQSSLYEQIVPLEAPAETFETCMTFDESWGALEVDTGRKSALEVLTLLAEATEAGGRMLLNLAPTGDGSVPSWQLERLEALAAWMTAHGEAIAGAGPSGLGHGRFYGPTTRRGSTYYLVAPLRPNGAVVLRDVRVRHVRGARLLGRDGEVPFRHRVAAIDRIFDPDPRGDVVFEVPAERSDPLATVIAVEVDGELV